jgi:hypothetical protein
VRFVGNTKPGKIQLQVWRGKAQRDLVTIGE